jgi:hypothetical protein
MSLQYFLQLQVTLQLSQNKNVKKVLNEQQKKLFKEKENSHFANIEAEKNSLTFPLSH